ncbi:MAG: hypothetical protein INH41_10140, partial [Myxococcaceae bacterium]|nr:hypothetical protein [Myxococcaceae bacterium]
PFDAQTFVNIAVLIITRPFAPLPEKNQLGEAIPPALRALVEQCLEKQREARPQTMAEVRDALRAVLREGSALASQAAAPAPHAGTGRSWRWLAAAGLPLLGALVAYGVWGGRPPPPVNDAPPPVVAPPLRALAIRDAGAAEASGDDAGAGARDDAGVGDDGGAGDDAGVAADAGVMGPVDAGQKVAPRPVKRVHLDDVMMTAYRRQRMAAINGCVQASKALLPQEGALQVTLAIGLDGDAKVTDTSPAVPALKACVKKALEGRRFPPLAAPVSVVLTFPFRSG